MPRPRCPGPVPGSPDKCVIDVTLMPSTLPQGGTSHPSWSPVAGGGRGTRRHAAIRCARSPCPPARLHQAPVRPPRPAAPPRPLHGVYHDTVRSHPVERSRHPLSACSPPPVSHVSERSADPTPYPGDPIPPERATVPIERFFPSRRCTSALSAIYFIVDRRGSPPPGPSEGSTSHSEPPSPSNYGGRV